MEIAIAVVLLLTCSNELWVAPSGVQKERIKPEDLFVLDMSGAQTAGPSHLKLSECTPLFLNAYTLREVLDGVYTLRLSVGIASEWLDSKCFVQDSRLALFCTATRKTLYWRPFCTNRNSQSPASK